MHLVLITSVITPTIAETVFSTEERFCQLQDSIKSVLSKIPSCFIIVLEGSSYTEGQTKTVMENGVHDIVHIDIDSYDKQVGEAFMLRTFFDSILFSDLKHERGIISVSKLSGRYVLVDDFKFYYDGETCVCKVSEPEMSYSGYGFIYTRYYSLPTIYLDRFLHGLNRCLLDGIFINIEHSFFLYEAIPLDKINYDNQKINVAGYIAPNGEYVED